MKGNWARKSAAVALGAGLLAAPVAADQPFNWTGFYAGINIGYAWGDVDVRDTNGGVPYGPFSYDNHGVLGGVTLGYNRQFERIVAGIEIDLGYLDLDGEGRIPSSTPPNYQRIWTEGGMYAVAAARLGVTIAPRTLVYGKGGAVWFDGEAGQQTTKPGYETHMADGFTGWAYGGGIEHVITDRLTLKLEYMRLDFGSEGGYQLSVGDAPIGYKYYDKHDLALDTVRFGLNYKLH